MPHILAIVQVILHAPADAQTGFIQLPIGPLRIERKELARPATVGGRRVIQPPQVCSLPHERSAVGLHLDSRS